MESIRQSTGRLQVVRALASAKADVNFTDLRRGETPLHAALEEGHNATAKALAEELGADKSKANRLGVTPEQLMEMEAIVYTLKHSQKNY